MSKDGRVGGRGGVVIDGKENTAPKSTTMTKTSMSTGELTAKAAVRSSMSMAPHTHSPPQLQPRPQPQPQPQRVSSPPTSNSTSNSPSNSMPGSSNVPSMRPSTTTPTTMSSVHLGELRQKLLNFEKLCANKTLLAGLEDKGAKLLRERDATIALIKAQEEEAVELEKAFSSLNLESSSSSSSSSSTSISNLNSKSKIIALDDYQQSGSNSGGGGGGAGGGRGERGVRIQAQDVSDYDLKSLYRTLTELDRGSTSSSTSSPPSTMADPPSLTTALLPHQRQGLHFMMHRERVLPGQTVSKSGVNSLRGGIIADDCGMGKTLQMIALIAATASRSTFTNTNKVPAKKKKNDSDDSEEEEEEGGIINSTATLIIAPRAVLTQWLEEIERHTKANTLRVYCYHGSKRNRDMEWVVNNHDVVISSYSIILSESTQSTEGKAQCLSQVAWRRIVLDEGHVIRNWKSKTSRAVCALHAERRWFMSGTPIQNHLDDLFSAFCFLHFEPYDNPAVWKKVVPSKPSEEVYARLKTLLSVLVLRRTKADKLPDGTPVVKLPPREVVQAARAIELTPRERQFYDRLSQLNKADTAALFEKKDSFSKILVMLLRQRQACAHYLLATGKKGENLKTGCALTRSAAHIELNWGVDNEQPKSSSSSSSSKLSSSSTTTTTTTTTASSSSSIRRIPKKETADNKQTITSKKTTTSITITTTTTTKKSTTKNHDSESESRSDDDDSDSDDDEVLSVTAALKAVSVKEKEKKTAEKEKRGSDRGKETGKGSISKSNVSNSNSNSNLNPNLKVEDLAVCGLCMEPLVACNRTATAKCTHRFCLDCISQHLENEEKGLCPECGLVIKLKELDVDECEDNGLSEDEEDRETTKRIGQGAKVEYVVNTLRRARQRDPTAKAVLFSQWSQMLDLLEPALRSYGIRFVRLDGAMSSQRQRESISVFNKDKDVVLFLVSLKAGGVGLNLTVANHLFLFDIWWNPAIEQQALDRVYRVGQTKPVFIHQLIAKGTVEEGILRLQKRKEYVARGALSKQSNLGQLTMDELRHLFR